MKQLEMSNFGVLEMQQEEMIGVDGGNPWLVVGGMFLWGFVQDSINNPQGCIQSFKQGLNTGLNANK